MELENKVTPNNKGFEFDEGIENEIDQALDDDGATPDTPEIELDFDIEEELKKEEIAQGQTGINDIIDKGIQPLQSSTPTPTTPTPTTPAPAVAPTVAPAPVKTYFITNLEPKPIYSRCKTTDKPLFPTPALKYLKEVYQKKSNAGKIFDIILTEAMRYSCKFIQGKRHTQVYRYCNFWIPFTDIYNKCGKSYRDNKRVMEAVKIIAEVLDGKFFYLPITKDGKKYLVVEFVPIVVSSGSANFRDVCNYDYSNLTNAELIFFRHVLAKLHNNGKQVFIFETLLDFGMIAWASCNNNKIIEKNTNDCLDKLQRDKRIILVVLPDGKYSITAVKI